MNHVNFDSLLCVRFIVITLVTVTRDCHSQLEDSVGLKLTRTIALPPFQCAVQCRNYPLLGANIEVQDARCAALIYPCGHDGGVYERLVGVADSETGRARR